MIPLPSAISSGLTWSKIPRSRNFALRLNGELAGALRRPSVWSSKFVAETHHGIWMFRRSGFFGTGAEIVDAVTEQPLATFKSGWSNRGTLTFADGQVFHIDCKGWWRPVWSVTTESGQPVLHLHTREKTVELSPSAGIPDSRVSLLTMFVWYRVQQAEEDAAGASTVAMMMTA